MDVEADSLTSAIGARVKQERASRGWTLDQLALASGVSRRVLVTLEQGGGNPSVGTLLRISGALGVGLPSLVEPPAPRPVRVTRQGQGARLWHSPAGGHGVLVAATDEPDVVELWDWVLAPGDSHSSEAHSAGTKELLVVHEGVVDLTVGQESAALAAGDAVSFAGDVEHAYANTGSQVARYTLTVVERGVAPRAWSQVVSGG